MFPAPWGPWGPVRPWGPCEPLNPWRPMIPWAPCVPLNPGDPARPIDPWEPLKPRGPIGPWSLLTLSTCERESVVINLSWIGSQATFSYIFTLHDLLSYRLREVQKKIILLVLILRESALCCLSIRQQILSCPEREREGRGKAAGGGEGSNFCCNHESYRSESQFFSEKFGKTQYPFFPFKTLNS